jgi:hypothetical protein
MSSSACPLVALTLLLGMIACADPDASATAAADSAAASARAAADSANKAARLKVQGALAVFAGELEAAPLDRASLPPRIRAYLEANPEFYGSTVTLIGADGKATTSPYVYRTASGLEEKELAVPEYDIDQQEWLAAARDSRQPFWTEPYFDAGGGEIWMMTRSVPLYRGDKVYAVVTTDLPVAPPLGAAKSP